MFRTLHFNRWAMLAAMLIPMLLFTLLETTHAFSVYPGGRATFLFTPPLPNAERKLLLLSSDPYTNKGGQHQTEVEPDTYAYNTTIVSTFQIGRFQDGGSTNIGWATSTDEGMNWKSGLLPGTTKVAGGPYDRISDPSVAYDPAHHTWLISSLAIIGNSPNISSPAVIVSRSTDGGLTWSTPVSVVNSGSTFYDKDWIVCDASALSPYYGHCYVEWDNDDLGGLVLMSTSIDGGNSWSKAESTPDSAVGLGGQPLVQPGGTVIVPFIGYGDSTIQAFTSKDGGKSWSNTITIDGSASSALPTAEIDGDGKVYIVWVDCRFEQGCNSNGGGKDNDLVMVTSSDGVHWSAVQRIPTAPVRSGIVYAVPGLGVDNTRVGSGAHLALAYYYRPSTCSGSCQYSVGFVSSIDGGAHWSPAIQLAGPFSVNWIAKGEGNARLGVGDYISTSFCEGLAFPVFALATASSGGHLNESMYTIAGGLTV